MSALNFLLSGHGVSGGGTSGVYTDDVFNVYTYNGTGSTQSLNTGQDLAGFGGMVHVKNRSTSIEHYITYSSIGTGSAGQYYYLKSDSVAAKTDPVTSGISSFGTSGFTVNGTSLNLNNTGGNNYVAWVFRNAAKFYGHQLVTKTSGTNRIVNFPELGTLGMVRVKRTDATGSWYVWHRSLSPGQLLIGETSAIPSTIGHIAVSGTSVTLVDGVIADGTYIIEAFAHDTSSNGIIQCGTFAGNTLQTLGWEPQYLLVKRVDLAGHWVVVDDIRGFAKNAFNELRLNTTDAQVNNSLTEGSSELTKTSAGFQNIGYLPGAYIYMAVRRSTKPPTSGTQIYNAIARTGNGNVTTLTGVGFAPDVVMSSPRVESPTIGLGFTFDRERGVLSSVTTRTIVQDDSSLDTLTGFDKMDGIVLGADISSGTKKINSPGTSYINHFFKRAVKCIDIVADQGTGVVHSVQHNLAAVPELILRKSRTITTQWEVWHKSLSTTEHLVLNSDAARATNTTIWNNTLPNLSSFTVGAEGNVNQSGVRYITYLFASLAGVSKVGSYGGNGSSQTIDCSFTTGARYILIKRTDAAGDWFVWDSVRGIVLGNDPHISLNSLAMEVTTDDSVDPDVSGFIVNQNAVTNINVLGASYIYLAFA